MQIESPTNLSRAALQPNSCQQLLVSFHPRGTTPILGSGTALLRAIDFQLNIRHFHGTVAPTASKIGMEFKTGFIENRKN
jgi:hypothetical protein